MKNIILILSFLFGGFISVSAQDISSVFLTMPDNIIAGLESDQKYTLVSKVADTAHVKVQTAIYENIERTAFSENFIALKTSEAGTTQIKLLPLINDSKIICVIKTVKGRSADSRISFYTTKWIPITQSNLFPARTINWFIKPNVDRSNQDFTNAIAMADILPMSMTISDKDNSVSVVFNIADYLNKEDYKRLQPFLTEQPKIFAWDKVSYK